MEFIFAATTVPRRVLGLSKHQRPQQLLKQIGGRSSQSLSSASPGDTASSFEMSRSKEEEDIDFITAPPQSSDDEEESQNLGRASIVDSSLDSDDDDDAMLRRGDIRPTNFSKPPSSQASDTQRSRREGNTSLSRHEEATSNLRAKKSSSLSQSKRSADEDQTNMGEHLRDDYGFTRPSKRPKAKHSSTYSSHSRSSQPRISQKSEPRSSASKDNDTSHPRQRFVQHDASLSPEAAKFSPKKFLKMHEDSIDSEEDPPGPSSKFKAPQLPSSPSFSPHAPGFKHATMSDDSPEKPKIDLFDLSTKASPSSDRRSLRSTTLRKSQSRAIPRSKKGSPKLTLEESSQRPTFKMPEVDDDDAGIIDSDAPESISQHSVENEAENDVYIEESQLIAIARCPMCHEVVDRELLNKHSDKNGRMSIKKQTAFCRLHNRKSALNSGSERGYPKINWGTLDSRCDRHQEFLKEILEGTQPSYFGKVLKEQVQSGKNRTLLKTEDSLTPGYYGPRGLRLMTEYIMRTLSTVVRKRAVEDRLISARGYTGYVQAVLVPELTVRLIMEDMDVVEKTAREIMQDSIEVGELLYEDVGDVIVNLSEGEDM